MTHRYYDYYMIFPSVENAKKAQDFYVSKYKQKIGGVFEIYKNGVCGLSLRDECEVIMDFYQFGMTRFIVADNEHGLKLEKGRQIYEFCTDTDVMYSYPYKKDLLNDIDIFLRNIDNDGFRLKEGEQPPIVKRHAKELDYDDVYDMLNIDVPGLDY